MIQTRLGEVWKNVAWKWQKCRGEVAEGDGDRDPVCNIIGEFWTQDIGLSMSRSLWLE